MRTFMKYALAGAASLALAGPANAAVITFGALSSPSAAFTTLTEAGFIITALSGSVFEEATGNPGPSLVFSGFGGTVEIVKAGGGTFSFAGFDFGNGGSSGSYLSEGFLGGSSIGFAFGSDAPIGIGIGGITGVMDRLTINISGAPTVFAAIDNINVTDTVPEPATWAMMLAGFGLVGSSMRRRANQTVRVKYA
jgi:PEP-CTERM motif